jgi:hypothetical protein
MISPTDLFHPSPAPHFKTLKVFLIYCPKRPSYSTIESYAPNVALLWLLPQFQVHCDNKKSPLLVECSFGKEYGD